MHTISQVLCGACPGPVGCGALVDSLDTPGALRSSWGCCGHRSWALLMRGCCICLRAGGRAGSIPHSGEVMSPSSPLSRSLDAPSEQQQPARGQNHSEEGLREPGGRDQAPPPLLGSARLPFHPSSPLSFPTQGLLPAPLTSSLTRSQRGALWSWGAWLFHGKAELAGPRWPLHGRAQSKDGPGGGSASVPSPPSIPVPQLGRLIQSLGVGVQSLLPPPHPLPTPRVLL